jgi:hypothetical protein
MIFSVGRLRIYRMCNCCLGDDPAILNWPLILFSDLKEELSEKTGENKYNFETKGKQTVKGYSQEYSYKYQSNAIGYVERCFETVLKKRAIYGTQPG